MNVNPAGQTNQTQMQMRKMDGTGGGQRKGMGQGMQDVLQNLSTEDQEVIQNLMQSIPQDQKASIKDQLKSIDASSMTSGQYMQSLLNILNPTSTEDTQTDDSTLSIYA